MDTLKCCVLCAVMWNVEMTCGFEGKVTKNTFEKGKKKSTIQNYWYSHPSKKWNLGTEHLKNEGVNLTEV